MSLANLLVNSGDLLVSLANLLVISAHLLVINKYGNQLRPADLEVQFKELFKIRPPFLDNRKYFICGV
ncbi:hypothetical protein MZM54_27310 [[Brevibacterium] frigoritolerans]|nr:hypothetical protein [Peribacillus frigoritolerans]